MKKIFLTTLAIFLSLGASAADTPDECVIQMGYKPHAKEPYIFKMSIVKH